MLLFDFIQLFLPNFYQKLEYSIFAVLASLFSINDTFQKKSLTEVQPP
jgi:hypothetical protein